MIQKINYLIIFSIVVLLFYGVFHKILVFSPEYQSLSYNKKCYVLKNLTKSLMLFLILVFFMNDLFVPALYNTWNNEYANLFANAYVSNDFVGLLIVPKLPKSTKMHHIISTSLLLYSYTINFQEENVGRWMFIYTLMSTFPFLVNSYLGLRFIQTKENSNINIFIDKIRVMAYYIYLSTCFFNWLVHGLLVSNKIYNFNLELPYIIYLFLLIPIINDDLILLNWLYNKH